MSQRHLSAILTLVLLFGGLTVASAGEPCGRIIYYEFPVCPPMPCPCPPICCPPLPCPKPACEPCHTPIVSLQLLAPAQISAGEEVEYRIIVENRSTAAAHHVLIRDPLPANAKFVRADPVPTTVTPELQWHLGTLAGCTKKEITLVLLPTNAEPIKNCVRVSFEHGLCVTTRQSQPKLRLTKQGPVEAQVNEPLTFHLNVANPGDSPAANVVITDTLPAGLEHSSGQKQLTFNIGVLPPGLERTVSYQVVAKGMGRLCNRAVATADGGLRDETEACVTVTEARISLAKTGPRRIYLNSDIPYRITVTNTGNATVTNLVLTDRLPARTNFLSASDGGRQAGNQVQWSLGTLAPGASRSVDLRIKPQVAGEVVNQAEAVADRGLRANAEARTEVLGVSALLLEVVDTVDPVIVGEDTQYNIIVANQGTLPATNVRIVALAPEELAVIRVQGPVDHRKEGQKVTFEPFTLPAGKDTVLRITVRAVKAGDIRFRVELTADQLTAGAVHEEESTNVFRDINGGPRNGSP